jgi:hypothetical protein
MPSHSCVPAAAVSVIRLLWSTVFSFITFTANNLGEKTMLLFGIFTRRKNRKNRPNIGDRYRREKAFELVSQTKNNELAIDVLIALLATEHKAKTEQNRKG